MSDLKKYDVTVELYREYNFGGRVYKIDEPVDLYMHKGGNTHRVVDSKGIVHCLPAPGVQGCVLRWKSKNPGVPVVF
jgi:hypothetical protein